MDLNTAECLISIKNRLKQVKEDLQSVLTVKDTSQTLETEERNKIVAIETYLQYAVSAFEKL